MVSVVIPTMNRVGIVKCAERLYETTKGMSVETVVVFDGDTYPFEALNVWRRESGHVWDVLSYHSVERLGAIAGWNRGLELSSGDYIVFAGDDLWWGEDWLAKALECHKKELRGHGMVGFNDEHNNGNVLSTHYLADREFVKSILGGRIAYPFFKFYCNDTVANRLAKKAGMFYWCEEAIVTHNHYVTGRREKDELDRENEPKLAADIQVLEEWIARGEKIEWEPVI